MDSSAKGFSSNPSPVSNPSNYGAGESNENELSSNQQMDVKMHNSKKPVKHFMSPTISAASKAKALAPKKKILGERNEALTFSDAHSQKSPNVGSRTGPLNTRKSHSGRSSPRVMAFSNCAVESDDDENNAFVVDSSLRPSYDPLTNYLKSHSGRSSPRVMSFSNCASESDDDENNSFVVDSSLRPYDPLTNYLSPRPKFLRYKPNRRREIICRLENERGEEKDGIDVKRSGSFDSQKIVDEEVLSGDAQDSSPLPLEEGLLKPDDEEEIEKKVGISSPLPFEEGLLKHDGEEAIEKKVGTYDEVGNDEEEVEEFEEEGGWSLKGIMKLLLVMFALFLSTSYILSMNSPTPSYAQQAIWSLKDGYNIVQEHLLKDVAVKIFGDGNGSQDQVDALVMGLLQKDDEFEELEYVEDDNEEVSGTGDEQLEMVEPIDGHSEHVGTHKVDEIDEESDQLNLAEKAKGDHVCGAQAEIKPQEDSDQVSGSRVADHDEDAVDSEVDITRTGFDHNEDADDHEVEKTLRGFDLPEEEIRKNYESFEGFQTQSRSEIVDDHNSVFDNEISSVSNHAVSVTEGDPAFDSQVKQIVETDEETIELENEIQNAQDLISKTGNEIIVSGIMEDALTESEVSSSDSDDGSMKIKNLEIGSVPTSVIVVLLSTILASLVFIYRSMKTRVVDKHSHQPRVKPIENSTITETLAPVVPSVEGKHIEKKVESFEKPSSLLDPSEKTPKHPSHVLAPEVALLGELVIGDRSFSLRTCERKTKMIESQESNKLSPQMEKILQFSTHSTSPPEHLPAVEFPTTDLPPYGSFTSEKKTLKKEKSRGAEAEVAVMTPVRRSSRIRNRSVMSP